MADPTAEKEALLAAVLQSAHTAEPGLADETTTGDIPVVAAGAASEPEPSEEEAYFEHITLREIHPEDAEDAEAPAAHSESDALAAIDDVARGETDRDPSEVSASLVDAFDDTGTLRKPDTVQDRPKVREPRSNGTSRIGEDTADDLAALFNRPVPWSNAPVDDPPPVHSTSESVTAPPPQSHDTAPPLPPDVDAMPPPTDIGTALPPPDIEATPPPDADAGFSPPDIEATPPPDIDAGFSPPTALPPPDIEAAPPAPHADTTPPPSYGHDTAEDLAALFNAPSPWDTSPPGSATASDPDADFDPLPDLYGPAAYTHSTGDIAEPEEASTDLEEPADRWHTGDIDTGRFEAESKNTTYSPAEWPWVGRSGDGGFWAPPPEGYDTASRNYASATADAQTVHENGSTRQGTNALATPTNPPASTTSERPTAHDSTAEPDGGLVARMRASFVELGGWTAVAQVALLAVGMLCIIQVFVLIVVSSYLSEASGEGGEIVAGSLAAHSKVDGVMLPALLAFTVVALVFAVWRSFASRGNASTPAGILGRPLGIPMALWRVLLAAITLLLVIIPSAPPNIGAAQRITQWAMVACAVLGAACFAAPRGLDPSPPTTKDDGASTKADAAATTGSRPAA